MKVGSDADYILEFKGIGKYFPGRSEERRVGKECTG